MFAELLSTGVDVGEYGGGLKRHFGLWQATALNITMIVGAGVFITIPPMLEMLPGPAAMLAWLAVGVLILVDSLVWSELGASLPGSGGSFVYLLEGFGRHRWGRLMAFLFIWQFLISGPLELASGLIAVDNFVGGLSTRFNEFNKHGTMRWVIWDAQNLVMIVSPVRVGCAFLGALLIALLYRRVENLGRLTLLFGAGVLAAAAWIAVEGALHFEPARAFDTSGASQLSGKSLLAGLGGAMVLALYSYLGYYNICYIGEEVRDPGRTIPRAILLSAAFVCLLFVTLHLAMLGTVPWKEVLADYKSAEKAAEPYNLPTVFMQKVRGDVAIPVILVLIIVSCLASAFSGLLGYSRIPFGAARTGHFFAVVGRVHPGHRIPHVSLLLVGGLTILWSFFDLQVVINAMISTRLLVQFVAQTIAVILLRRNQPFLARPFRMPLYPLPCVLAAVGWVALWLATGWLYVALSLATLAAGVVAFLGWSWYGESWPFGQVREP
jgi:amino acid transporter